METQSQKNALPINVAKLLCHLAIVKNVERTEKQIAAYAEYLVKYFSYDEISKASEYILQRSPYFPGINDYFTILRPIGTLDQRALELTGEFEMAIKTSAGNYHYFIQNNRSELVQFVTDYGFNECQKMYKKDMIEAFKSIINKPSFFLDTIKGTSNEKAITRA